MLKRQIILFLGVLSLFNNSVLASASNKEFYLKTIAVLNKTSNIKTIDSDINFILDQKANPSVTLGVGIGYYTNSFSRIDLVFENSNINFATKGNHFQFVDDNILNTGTGTRSIKRTTNIQSIMLNGYIDIIKGSKFKVFLGTGVGLSKIKEKTFDRFESTITNGHIITLPTIFTSKANKNKKAFSYAFTGGTDISVCKNFNIEVAYSWKYSGKVKTDDNTKNKYQGHSLSLAARFDL
jgi:opacity protein-like surface antigen